MTGKADAKRKTAGMRLKRHADSPADAWFDKTLKRDRPDAWLARDSASAIQIR